MTDAPRFLIDTLIEDARWEEALPQATDLATRVAYAIALSERVNGEAALLLADDAVLQGLNARHRGLDKPTNVLAFPAVEAPGRGVRAFGDVAISLDVAQREAAAQGKTLEAHVAHLIAHGALHLLGYDHETDEDAARMEALERALLARLGFGDPYAEASP